MLKVTRAPSARRYRQRWHPDSVAADQLFGAETGAEKAPDMRAVFTTGGLLTRC